MREKLGFWLDDAQVVRITPAYAGKTTHSFAETFSRWDHPRVCGKNVYKGVCQCTLVGSPPRMREKQKGKIKGA